MSASMAPPTGRHGARNPLRHFPQKFYCGETPLLLDLTEHADVKFVRAHWEVARWGRGTETPMFEFGVTMKEVPARYSARGDGRGQSDGLKNC